MPGKLIIQHGHLLTMGGRLITKCPGCAPHVPFGQMRITYSWPPPSNDLDTCTIFLEQKVGFSNGSYTTQYLQMDSNDNTGPGPETIWVKVDQSLTDGAWSIQTDIACWCGWYATTGGSGPATLTVTYNNKTQTKQIPSIGNQSGSAEGTTLAGTIILKADGTFLIQ